MQSPMPGGEEFAHVLLIRTTAGYRFVGHHRNSLDITTAINEPLPDVLALMYADLVWVAYLSEITGTVRIDAVGTDPFDPVLLSLMGGLPDDAAPIAVVIV